MKAAPLMSTPGVLPAPMMMDPTPLGPIVDMETPMETLVYGLTMGTMIVLLWGVGVPLHSIITEHITAGNIAMLLIRQLIIQPIVMALEPLLMGGLAFL